MTGFGRERGQRPPASAATGQNPVRSSVPCAWARPPSTSPTTLVGHRRHSAATDHEFPHRFEHRTYDDVGHFIGTPYAPLGALGDETRQRATVRASEDAWPLVLAYLETGLQE